ncbi:hypothetical protein CDV52_15880 [Haematobacter missouriensis]|uniref:Uncharacterized protein n=3 Tax=Haematobacter TaxID=366614 RepID=A0A086XSA5_9RHOB|nr:MULTISPECIES: hypothetical protein [Haematobacter]KFI24905.1 hypothetical protein CN97_11565 [Haematobacter massiliensis]OWJ69590.1 hypothetical protein CDV50_17215 [Haematobacter massiliensis]OWJ73814.1 hypothetical protein CDV53_14920 [Haematobacter missouriensis]OWJ77500.1 hypothetical protein CDV49_11270 [Haematobacter genomosp. 1]OWJ81940.1 hypothetical protein CDV51_18670 [Haematobacter massiliensis]
MTIGELERRAGIEQTPEARAQFWKPFAHLEARAMLDAARQELYRLIEAQSQGDDEPADGVTAQEHKALRAFASEHGRCWKAELRKQWMSASAEPVLHRLRNRLGPSWLVRFRLDR